MEHAKYLSSSSKIDPKEHGSAMKYNDWLNTYTFENCAVGRGRYGKFLVSYIAGEDDGFVLNLNGCWGSGKTEFLKRMYTELHKRNHPVIYIDAWESDFTDNPLLVISSELLNQLSEMFEVSGSDMDKLTEYLGKFAKGTSIALSAFVSKKLLGESSVGVEMAKALFEKSPQDFLNSLKDDYSEQIEAIKNVRMQLEQLAENLKEQHDKQTPVVVLVDELDRCRPNYAIEMLEVIKHFFTTKHFVFVVATDTAQLKHSIKAVYGNKFDSETYLRRFFNREARLGEPDLNNFINTYSFDIPHNLILYPSLNNQHSDQPIQQFLTWTIRAFELTLRDADQLVAKIKSSLRTIGRDEDTIQLVNIFSLIIALVEFERDHESFMQRTTSNSLDQWNKEDFFVDVTNDDSPPKFGAIYRLNMNHSVKHIYTYDDGYTSNQKGIGFAHEIQKFRLNRERESRLTLQMDSSIRNTIRNNKSAKVWLWDDYKDVVKLSATLS